MPIRYSNIILFFLLILALAFFSALSPANAQSVPELSVHVSADGNSFASSESVIVHVVLTNTTNEDIRVLLWHTPENGVLEPLFNITRDGVSVNYLGALYKRPYPTEQDYIVVAAGESLEYGVDLSQYYSFVESGEYVVTYNTSSQNLYGLNVPGTLVSEPIQLDVVGRPDPLKKVIQPQAVSGNTTFNACTPSQQNVLVVARNDASTYANTANTYFNNNRAGALYQLWFGVYDASRYALIKDHFKSISIATDTETVNFDCGCMDPYYAYVFPSLPYNIYLCTYFWSAPAIGTDSKAGTLIHELSHFTVLGGTNDYVYGQTGAKALAISNPAQAVMNADNHEYFSENTPVTADNAPAYTLSETSFSFGNQTTGETSAVHSFTITNRGDINLSIGQLSVSSQFNLLNDTCSNVVVGSGATCTFGIAFAPTSAGGKVGAVTIPSNATIATSISLSGNGIAPVLHTISGSTGISGVSLNFTDGTPKMSLSNTSGNYSFTVSLGWSGTVTPSHACYSFSPANIVFTNLQASQNNQNFTPTLLPNKVCTLTIVRSGTSPTNAASVDFTITFTTGVTGVDVNDFSLTTTGGVTGASITGVTPVSASVYTVSVNTGSGDGTIRLDVPNTATIKDLANNDLSGLPFVSGEAYTIQKETGTKVLMGNVEKSSQTIPNNSTAFQEYANFAGGPVKIKNFDGDPIVLSERVLYSFGGVLESYYEMMAVPSQQLSTEYWYPYSTNVGVNTQIRVGNAGNATANVEVRIAGTLVGSYTIAPNSLGAYTYYNVVGGPVRVTSTNGVPIVSTQRFIFTKDGINPASFAETMGLPATQLGTEYWFPVYNNSTTNSELRIGNAGNSSATVDIYMGGVKQGATLSIAPNTTQLVSFAGLAAGPVRIVSTNAVPIVVTERVLYSFGGVLESYYEMLALPSQQLSTEYWYPYSTNVGVNTQIRVGNAGNATANVEVRIAGTLVGSYTIAPNSLGAYTYYNVVGGPVQVTSTNGVPITSTQRFIFTKDGINPTSFAETMGLPLEQLSDEYWFPVYNNSTTNSQLRIANP